MPMPSRAISIRPELVALLAGAALAGTPAGAVELQASASEPRAFGYQLGDTVERRVLVQVPDGLVLDEASLPRPGAQGRAIELRSVTRRSEAEAGGTRHELRLVYQLFLSPPEVRTLEIAPVVLRFDGQPRAQELRIEAWPVTVAPLMPVEASPRRGLGELRPDRPPPLIDTRPARLRLAAYGLVLLLLLGYLAQVYLGLPWWARRQRPMARAWRELPGLPAAAAFERMHAALNETAGEALFEPGLARFVAAQPRYAELRQDLAEFFQRSRRAFFAQGGVAADDGPWLRAFCRRCRDAERGAA